MRRIAIAIFAALLAVALGATSRPAPKPPISVDSIVARALAGESTGDYVAEVVTRVRYCGRDVESRATIYHSGTKQRIESAGNGLGSAWSLTDGGVTHTFVPAGRRLLRSEARSAVSAREHARLLRRNYQAQYRGQDDVAGRIAYVVRLLPRQAGRPSKTLWVDRERFHILKSVDFSASGRERGSTETARIAYGVEIEPSRFDLPTNASLRAMEVASPMEPGELGEALGIGVATPRYVPAGYVLEGYGLFRSQCNCGHRSAQITYTDGLNTISVFDTPTSSKCLGDACDAHAGGSECCAVQGCDAAQAGRLVRGDRIVVVVADLPEAEIRKIAESVP